MKNDTRSSVFNWHGKARRLSRFSVCLGSVLALNGAWADVGLPPPAQHQGAGFPSEQALKQRGYDPKTGVWRVQTQNQGKPTVTKNGGTITGSQNKSVTVTGKYGEKVVIQTPQTQSVNSSKLQNAANGLIAGNFIGGALKYSSPYIENATRALKNGNYGTAAHNLVMSGGAFLDGLLGGGLGSVSQAIGRGLGTLPSEPSSGQLTQAAQKAATAQAQAEQGGNLGGAIAAAAAKKAAEGAAAAAKQAEGWNTSGKLLAKASKNKDGSYSQLYLRRVDIGSGSNVSPKKPIEGYSWVIDRYNGIYNWGYCPGGACNGWYKGSLPEGYDTVAGYVYTPITNDAELQAARAKVSGKTPAEQEQTIKDMTLNQQDIKDILQRMLNNNQTNHEELMKQLSRIGDAVEKSTESNQFTPMTADSAPYTPQGSNTPQQTRFTINADGSISTTIIPRPDLKPNSTTAPTRSEIIPTPNKGQDNPAPTTPTSPDSPNTPTTPGNLNTPTTPAGQTGQENQNQNQERRDFCESNPNAAQCLDAGDSSWEDIQLPEQTIDLDFKPLEVFSNNGTCPAPRAVDFGALGTVEFVFDPLCDLAGKLRPIFIAICILTCSYFVYQSVKDL